MAAVDAFGLGKVTSVGLLYKALLFYFLQLKKHIH